MQPLKQEQLERQGTSVDVCASACFFVSVCESVKRDKENQSESFGP